jgi:hypothetical protein
MAGRTCGARNADKQPCKQAPTFDGEFCFWHDPARAEEAAEARRLGGQRRRRERIVSGAFDFEGLDSIPKIRRLLDIAATDALSLDGSVAKIRALVSLAGAATRLLETGEFEDRLGAIESVLGERLPANEKGSRR